MSSSSYNIIKCPNPTTKTSAAQSVPGANGGGSAGASSHCGNYDEHDNKLINLISARHNNGSASSAPGPGLLANGTASDIEMRWWW